MELTKEHFDKVLKGLSIKEDLTGLAKKEDLASLAKSTKEDLRKAVAPLATTRQVQEIVDKAVEELARITNSGFEDVLDRLDVRERMAKMEKKMMKIEQALHMEIEV